MAAVMVALVSSTTFAGEGQVSNSQLTEMGLPGLTVMTDAQGAEIRGHGFAYASSYSDAFDPQLNGITMQSAKALGYRKAEAAPGARVVVKKSKGTYKNGKLSAMKSKMVLSTSGYAYASAK